LNLESQKYNLSKQFQMPECHRELINNTTQIAVWKITEDETQLTQGLKLSRSIKSFISKKKYSAPQRLFGHKTAA
jgi:hypothetical protein